MMNQQCSLTVLTYPNMQYQGKILGSNINEKPIGPKPNKYWVYSTLAVPYGDCEALSKELKC